MQQPYAACSACFHCHVSAALCGPSSLLTYTCSGVLLCPSVVHLVLKLFPAACSLCADMGTVWLLAWSANGPHFVAWCFAILLAGKRPSLVCGYVFVAPCCCVPVSCRSWDIPSCLQPVLGSWVAAQTSGFAVWVERQLQQESWEPLGEQQVGRHGGRGCCACGWCRVCEQRLCRRNCWEPLGEQQVGRHEGRSCRVYMW